MASVSGLPAPALQASKAALSAALAENQSKESEKANGEDENLEPGEIQEVDMQAQAETIRTVFSDPTNFNVKVRHLLFKRAITRYSCVIWRYYSILFSRRGLYGSIPQPPRGAISHRHL